MAHPASVWCAIRGHYEAQSQQREFIYSLAARLGNDMINLQVKKEDQQQWWKPWAEITQATHETDTDKLIQQEQLKDFAATAAQFFKSEK